MIYATRQNELKGVNVRDHITEVIDDLCADERALGYFLGLGGFSQQGLDRLAELDPEAHARLVPWGTDAEPLITSSIRELRERPKMISADLQELLTRLEGRSAETRLSVLLQRAAVVQRGTPDCDRVLAEYDRAREEWLSTRGEGQNAPLRLT